MRARSFSGDLLLEQGNVFDRDQSRRRSFAVPRRQAGTALNQTPRLGQPEDIATPNGWVPDVEPGATGAGEQSID